MDMKLALFLKLIYRRFDSVITLDYFLLFLFQNNTFKIGWKVVLKYSKN